MAKYIESAIQRELIKWINLEHPSIEVIFRKNEGKKSLLTAKLDKLMGLTAGIPDLQLLLAQNNFTYILELELKKIVGSLNPNQIIWHNSFIPSDNRKLATAYGLVHAQSIITEWLESIV